jgi:hypothetical protein
MPFAPNPLSAAGYVPKTMILYVNGTGDEVALLRPVIFLP